MSTAVAEATVMMTEAEARACVARIKANLEDVRAALFELRDQEGWRALGYKTWHECIKHEFHMSRQHAHRLLNAHMVDRILAPILAETSPAGDVPTVPEAHARQLSPLIEKPDEMRQVYADAIETSGGTPTEEHVHHAVDRHLGREQKPLRPDRPKSERRSVSGNGAQSSDFPPEPEYEVSQDPGDEAFGFSNEPHRGGPAKQRCNDCGDYNPVGTACPCTSVTEPEPVGDGGGYQPAARTSSSGLGNRAVPTATYSGPPPMVLPRSNAADALRAVSGEFSIAKLAEGLPEAFDSQELRSLIVAGLDALPTDMLAPLLHRATVRLKPADNAPVSGAPAVPSTASLAEWEAAAVANLTPGLRLALASRLLFDQPDQEEQRKRLFIRLKAEFEPPSTAELLAGKRVS